MAKNHDDKCICPLYKREISYAECYEVQEVIEDEMDAELLIEPINIESAKAICEKCRFYVVS